MKQYSDKISLVKNGRGVYCIDTTMGCSSGLKANAGGCYNDCYSARIAKRYGHDFSVTVLRKFKNNHHKREILSQINKIKMPFIRIGASGDPSENWQHTIDIIKHLENCSKEIVIITRHWTSLTLDQLNYLSTANICINTSVSALDNLEMIERSLFEYNRIKPFCKSVLRVITCNFNLQNLKGLELNKIQSELLKNDSILDTVFRPSKSNKFLLDEIVLAKEEIFNGKKQLSSKAYKKTYMGKCGKCLEMCGVNIETPQSYPNKRFIPKQLTIL